MTKEQNFLYNKFLKHYNFTDNLVNFTFYLIISRGDTAYAKLYKNKIVWVC